MSSAETIRIDPNLISDADYEIGCRVLCSAVRAYFAKPGVREEFEEWLKTEEGQAADSSSKGGIR